MSHTGPLNTNDPQNAQVIITDDGEAIPVDNELEILGQNGITTSASGNTVNIIGINATSAATVGSSQIGVSSFNSDDFTVTDGFVSLNPISGFVTSVSGTPNRITSTGGSDPQIDIANNYVGQTSLVTLGTVTTGDWNATPIDLASYVSGNLAVTHLNSGTSASVSTFWRGDGTWATPTDTGIVSVGAFGSTPNANALSVTGTVLNMQPADGTFPGGVSTTTQNFAGAKIFNTSAASASFQSISGGGGVATIQYPSSATSFNFNMPTSAGTSGFFLTSGGGGSTNMSWTDPATGVTSITGTANQITASAATGAVTLSIPNDFSVSTNAGANTLLIGTGGGAKSVTLGSTNTTSTTVIKSGSGNIALNSGLTVDSTGRMTNAVQPAFSAYRSSTIASVTGDNTVYTVIWDSTSTDQGSNFNTSTGTYTFPVTGLYQMNVTVGFTGITVAYTQATVQIVANGRVYQLMQYNPGVLPVSGVVLFSGSVLVNAAATATAIVQVVVNGSTKSVGVEGNGSGNQSTFSGFLVC